MKSYQKLFISTCMVGLGLTALTVLPANAGRGLDSPIKYGDYGDTHLRYPGDSRIREGNIRTDGTDKGAYIERCSWSFNPGFGKGFGLTQKCRRYTIKNTQ